MHIGWRLHVSLLGLFLCMVSGCASIDHGSRTLIKVRHRSSVQKNQDFVHQSGPEFPTFAEVQSLRANPTQEGALSKKLNKLWTTPIIDNSAYYNGKIPTIASNEWMGSFIRFSEWNIEKSLEMDRAIDALNSEESYERLIDPDKAPEGKSVRARMLRQRARLAALDILVTMEMDIGVPRSGYRNAAADLAAALGMNYAYGTQYVSSKIPGIPVYRSIRLPFRCIGFG